MMVQHCSSCEVLKKEIEVLKAELTALKKGNLFRENNKGDIKTSNAKIMSEVKYNRCSLSNSEIERYSRQIILPEIGVSGQSKIVESSVLVVGAGGLGCPSATYLTASGVGCIGIVDYDTVDKSNLHRQVLHTETSIGTRKVDSLVQRLSELNSSINFDKYYTSLSSSNALEIIKKYDVVLDCTDNVATRYLLNDACIFLKKPLVSGSAIRFEGQLTVYNHFNSPCYRCLYPTPPPVETVTNCSDGGVIGAVTGVIGTLQALEAMNIIIGNKPAYSGKLLLYDGYNGLFRTIKLRGKQKECKLCGDDPSLKELIDYEEFCGSLATDKETKLNILKEKNRISVERFSSLNPTSYTLIDVRPKVEYEICSLSHSINVPIADILSKKNSQYFNDLLKNKDKLFVVCKRGNDSQKAVQEIFNYIDSKGMDLKLDVKDVIGGLTAWHRNIDNSFPYY